MMCFLREFAYIWTPANCIQLHNVCKQVCVCAKDKKCVLACACKRTLKQTLQRQMAQVPSTPMFKHRSCRRIASLAACVFCCGCVTPCVCVPWQRVTLCSDRDWCCGPWWYQREERQQTESLDSRGNTPDNTQEKKRHFVFYGSSFKRKAESDSQSDSLPLLRPKVHC